MKRIIDLDKIIEDREKEKQRQTKKSTQWERMKNDPVKFDHYMRKQYVNKKKEKEARAISTSVVAVPFEKVRLSNYILSVVVNPNPLSFLII